jgi:hypothetical protein
MCALANCRLVQAPLLKGIRFTSMVLGGYCVYVTLNVLGLDALQLPPPKTVFWMAGIGGGTVFIRGLATVVGLQVGLSPRSFATADTFGIVCFGAIVCGSILITALSSASESFDWWYLILIIFYSKVTGTIISTLMIAGNITEQASSNRG